MQLSHYSYFKRVSPLAFWIGLLFLISCGTSSRPTSTNEKPLWISNHLSDQYIGVGQAASLEDANKKAVNHALSLIRLSIYGGDILSLTEMSQMETKYEYDETFKAFSALSISGYVKATQMEAYAERDFDGDDLIFRAYVLMAFNRQEYTQWVLGQIHVIKGLVQDIEDNAANIDKSPTPLEIVNLFTYMELATANYLTLEEAGNNSVYSGEIFGIRQQLEKVAIDHLNDIKFNLRSSEIFVNPFAIDEVNTDIIITNKSGQSLINFPYVLTYKISSESIATSLTDDLGGISVHIPPSTKPGSTLRMKITPAIHGIVQNALPSSSLKIILKYPVLVNIILGDDNGYLRAGSGGSELMKYLDNNVFVIDDKAGIGGRVEGSIRFVNSSQMYNKVFYARAEADLKFYPIRNSEDFMNVSFEITGEGKDFEQATRNAYNLAAQEISGTINSKLGY